MRGQKKLDKNWLSSFTTYNHSVAFILRYDSTLVRTRSFVGFHFFPVCLFVGVRVWRNTLYALTLFGLTLKASPVWLSFIFGDGYGFFMPSLRFFLPHCSLIPKEITNTKNTALCNAIRADRIGSRRFFSWSSTIFWYFWNCKCTKNCPKEP